MTVMVMKQAYLDIMEKALSAYTAEGIRAYIDEVRRDGLTEHGFPRLAANLGILIAHGRRPELTALFIEIMDLCCEEIPKRHAANDFSVREVCCCLMLLEEKGAVSKALLDKWKGNLAAFDPWKFYDMVDNRSGRFFNNWALFAAVSEFMRGIFCGFDATDFVDWQLPCQIANLDENDMYMDAPPEHTCSNPMVYDLAPRFLFAFLMRADYKGKFAARVEEILDNTADLTLKMQSVTGEPPFGGRSNQFIHNEAMLCAYFEMESARFAEKGDAAMAGQLRAAAIRAADSAVKQLSVEPIHHIKNRYPLSSKIGCEHYGYFNKYMITVASNIYPAILFGNERIAPRAAQGSCVVSTGAHFGKTFLNAAGYQLEIETNADPHYDANGLGRVHKAGCPGALCLSVPFPSHPNYVLEAPNPTAMSLCCYAEKDGKKLLGAENYAKHALISSESSENTASAVFEVTLSDEITVTQTYAISEKGVDISLSGCENIGFMLPVFDFDGAAHTKITLSENAVSAEYMGSICTYSFDGPLSEEYAVYYNRNGRYRVYQLAAQRLHIEMKENANAV